VTELDVPRGAVAPDVDIALLRARLRVTGLDAEDLADDPLEQFGRWHTEWADTRPVDSNATVLCTVDPDGRPDGRYVDLARVDRGFVLLTDFDSPKALDLTANPHAALCFGWLALDRQVCVRGHVERLSDIDSDGYFGATPRPVQLLVWATDQSRSIGGRNVVEDRLVHARQRFAGQEIPRPRHWGGYRLIPYELEFWQGRANLVADRLLCQRSALSEPWTVARLAP